MSAPPAQLFIWTSRQGRGTASEDLALRPRYSQPTEARFTGLAGVALFMDGGKKNEKRKGWREGGQTSVLFLSLPCETPSPPLAHSFLLSANSIPFQSPSERSENAPSYYITYAVHQSDRVWITLSMTPKSWRYQTPGLHGIAVTTSGPWNKTGSLSVGLTEWNFSLCSPALFSSVQTWLEVVFTACQTQESSQWPILSPFPLWNLFQSSFEYLFLNIINPFHPKPLGALQNCRSAALTPLCFDSTYLWSSWTPFAGWFWHPAGARPPLTSSTAESLVLLTADPPWVSSTLTNPPQLSVSDSPHPSLSQCRSWVEKISLESMVTRLVFLSEWRSSVDTCSPSLVAHSVWVSLTNSWKDDWIKGWPILTRAASDQIWHLLECTWVLSIKVKYHMVHCCSFLRVHLLLWGNSPPRWDYNID